MGGSGGMPPWESVLSTPQTYQIVIQKFLNGEYWVNDYHVQAASPSEAHTRGLAIVAIERSVHKVITAFVNMRVRNAAGGGQGTVYPLGLFGQAGVDDYFPLYCTVRVDMSPEFGRVGRKYLRLPLEEGGATNGTLTASTINFINQSYATPLANLAYVCKPNGQDFVAASAVPGLQMRQLRRGTRRRTQPII